MSGPTAQGASPAYGAPAPAPATPPPPVWAPAGGPYLPNMRHDPWGLISFASRAVGFLLIFISALVIVAVVSYPGGCFVTGTPPSNCGLTWAANAATATLVGKLIAVLGLAALGFGSAVKLHYGLRSSSATTADEGRVLASERRANGALFIASIVLLVVVTLTVNVFPSLAVP
ncbi:MAG: hypothetical protein L3K14_02435 [Thermoplasmata archaeon]|nr:hypothetical protein [Thermoplasmata archaeon]